MRLQERDSQLAAAAVQLLEHELAERLEEHPEGSFATHMSPGEREAFDQHDRITQIVRKLATSGDHELFDWEANLVRESLRRYEAALRSEGLPATLLTDDRSQYITTESQRRATLERTQRLLRKFT